MSTASFTISGQVNVSVTLTENADGSITFDVAVLDDTGSIGDLNAIFFDLFDDNLTDGLSVTGDDVTDSAFKVDSVTKVDSFTNMNGEVVKDLSKFDGGIQFGTQGIGEDDIRETSFTLSHDSVDLTLADFSMQDFGARLTSVGAEGGSREGSLKLGETAPELIGEPEEPEGPVNTANADSMTVSELASFTPDFFDFRDSLDNGESVLENDTTDDGQYLGDVTAVNGDPASLEQIVAGSNGGYIKIFADGTVDFSSSNNETGVNEFEYLNLGDQAITNFEYSIDGGSTTTLTVTVNGVDDGTDSGGGGFPGGGEEFF